MKKIVSLVYFSLGFSLFISISTPIARAEGDGACRADAKKLCAGIEPGGGRIMKCLKEHEADLSAECKAKRTEMKGKMQEKMKQHHEACKEDFNKFCKDVQPGEGRIVKCMKEHESALSDACKATMSKKHE